MNNRAMLCVIITTCICASTFRMAHAADETPNVMKYLYPEGPVRLDLLAPDPEQERIRNLPGNRWSYIPLGPGETSDTMPDSTMHERQIKEDQEKLLKALE